MTDVRFGFQAAAAGDGGQSDQELYRDLMDDCALGSRLGYDAAWLLEHHFSDYFPTPSPLLLMSHIAARFPDLSLGTSVLVLPWYHPLRLAEEIAMLNLLSKGTLHLGIGRGTARLSTIASWPHAFSAATSPSRNAVCASCQYPAQSPTA